jgi:hypothetical protein
MAQPSRERKEAILELQQLAPLHKGPKSNTKNAKNTDPELNDIENPRPEDILGVEAVETAQVNKISKGKIKVDVLQAQKNGEENSTVEKCRLFPSQHDGQDQDPVQESIILEMNVVDDKQARGEKNRETGHVGSLFVPGRSRLNVSIRIGKN